MGKTIEPQIDLAVQGQKYWRIPGMGDREVSEQDLKILSLSSQLTFLENGGNDGGIMMVEQVQGKRAWDQSHVCVCVCVCLSALAASSED